MGRITILFGTESGNAEMVADDIAEVFADRGVENDVESMEDVDVPQLAAMDFAVVITSTYGDGELPMTTAPFHEALVEQEPDLSSLRFAAFGLGDRTYDTYNNAISTLVGTLVRLGATQVGQTGRHDASGAETYTETAQSWATGLMDDALVDAIASA